MVAETIPRPRGLVPGGRGVPGGISPPAQARTATSECELVPGRRGLASNLLARLRRERGLTYVLVSHNLAVVAHLCERLLVRNAGRGVEELTADQLRAATPAEPYTRQLLRASLGHDSQATAQLTTFD